MGEAFDHACKTLQDFGSAVPAIVANFIIAAAKNGERDAGRLYEQVLADYGIKTCPDCNGDGVVEMTMNSNAQRAVAVVD